LTGIDEALPDDIRDEYTHSIRLLSTVSGGGVGAMYFAERYKKSGFDRTNLRQVVEKAQASTLDDVAWGVNGGPRSGRISVQPIFSTRRLWTLASVS
jgi:hypothetical protein